MTRTSSFPAAAKTASIAALAGVAMLAVVAGGVTGAQAPPQSGAAPFMDGHVHITDRVYREGIDPWVPQPVGPFDYARAREGGLNVVLDNIGAYGYEDYNGTVKQVGRLIETFHRVLDAHPDKMELALTGADVRRIVASGKMAVLLGIESGFDQDGDIDILRLWYRLGVRSIQFTSMMTTAYADATGRGGEHWGGINDRGRQLIAEMNRLGILIDITHATEPAMRQIVAASRAPVVASHVVMRSAAGGAAGVPDDIVQAVRSKGGVISLNSAAAAISPRYAEWRQGRPRATINGLTQAETLRPTLPFVRPRAPDYGEYWNAFDGEMMNRWRRFWAVPWREDPEGAALVPTVDDWADYVARAVAVAGPEHIAIGLDLFQSGSYFRDFDARHYHRLAEALKKRGVPTAVLAENWLRVLDTARVR